MVVDKPAGPTSHDVVQRVRRLAGERRVGHAGTLDPMATGVLVICLGRATGIAQYLADGAKEYAARAVFGLTTSTQDATGVELRVTDASALCASAVEQALGAFRGPIRQVPPMVSAVKLGGRRLYELARRGIEVERAPRPVTIHRIELEAFRSGSRAEADIRVACSSGTYIRTLLHDLGEMLGVGACMAALRRTRSGAFGLKDAHALDELADRGVESALLPIAHALPDWPREVLAPDEIQRLLNGCSLPRREPDRQGALRLAVSPDGCALAVCRWSDGLLAPVRIVAAADSSAPPAP
ncbi:MAG TPA: tRNA pseudouridine(55) synthase TruB [Chthonomonadales bacterium]|nr:tRNA pseudouridine(55) synthase TruB [Chthonomonadales bacterium]